MRSVAFGLFKYLTWVLVAIICLFFLSKTSLDLLARSGIMIGCMIVIDILFNVDAIVTRMVKTKKKRSDNDSREKLAKAQREAKDAKKLAGLFEKENRRLRKKLGTDEELVPITLTEPEKAQTDEASSKTVKEAAKEAVVAVKEGFGKLFASGEE